MKLPAKYATSAVSVAALALAACAATSTRQSTGGVIDDAAITAKVAAGLVGDADTKAYQINVDTYKGRVQLNGFVDDPAARAEAGRIAAATEGVLGVDNNLVVQPAERTAQTVLDDAAITARVKSALLADGRTGGLQINVDTHSGVVHLGGFVDSAAARAAAGDIAGGIDGVREVRNDLGVRAEVAAR